MTFLYLPKVFGHLLKTKVYSSLDLRLSVIYLFPLEKPTLKVPRVRQREKSPAFQLKLPLAGNVC